MDIMPPGHFTFKSYLPVPLSLSLSLIIISLSHTHFHALTHLRETSPARNFRGLQPEAESEHEQHPEVVEDDSREEAAQVEGVPLQPLAGRESRILGGPVGGVCEEAARLREPWHGSGVGPRERTGIGPAREEPFHHGWP